MTEEERRILDHQLDRLERCLIRSQKEYKAERNKQRALRRQKKREEEERRRGPDAPENDAKH
ncbi:hypothetical protein D3C83_229510 [compost metagenome]